MSNPLVRKRIDPNRIAAIGSRPKKQEVYRTVSTEKELKESIHEYKNGEIIDISPANQEGLKRVQIVLSKNYDRIAVEIYNYDTRGTDHARIPLSKEPYTEEAFNELNNIHNMNVPGAVVNGSQPGAAVNRNQSYGSQPGAKSYGSQPGAANAGGKQQTKRHHYKNRRTKRRHNKKRQTKRRR